MRNDGGSMVRAVLGALASVPDIFREEEKEEHNKAVRDNSKLMDRVHNQACMVTQLAKQNSLYNGPMLESIRGREKDLENRVEDLKKMKADLLKILNNMK